MIYLELFLEFLKIGAFSFGGGYVIITVIRDAALSNGWLTEEELMSFIAVSESTPGPIAINMATFVGSEKGGLLGAVIATLGVVLPAFVIILIIAALISNFMKFAGVKAFLAGVRPCVVALIMATSITMGVNTLFGISTVKKISPVVDIRGIIILAILFGISAAAKKLKGKKPSPILMILLSAGLGILSYYPYA